MVVSPDQQYLLLQSHRAWLGVAMQAQQQEKKCKFAKGHDHGVGTTEGTGAEHYTRTGGVTTPQLPVVVSCYPVAAGLAVSREGPRGRSQHRP